MKTTKTSTTTRTRTSTNNTTRATKTMKWSNSTGYRGVQATTNGKFRARYWTGTETVSIGTYNTALAAYRAYTKYKNTYNN